MTYFELVKKIQEICENHKQVQSYGYGVLSNIENPLVYDDRRYPYVFLNPTPHTMTNGQLTYNFNMIVMDLASDDYRDNFTEWKKEDLVLRAQSDMLLIINDILGYLEYELDPNYPGVELGITVTPFEEKHNDSVAGMTATIKLIVPNRLSACEPIISA